MRKTMLTLLCLLVAVAMQSQRTFAPGQVLFKMRDASPVTVQNGNGRLRTSNANINNVLTEFGVQSMKKVLPDAKPVANPRRTKAPDGKSYVYEHDLSQLYKVCMADTSEVRTLELVRRLNDMPEVEYAQPNFRYSINEPATTVGTDSCICPPQTAHPALRTNTRICPYEALRQAEEGSSKGFYDDEEGRTLMYYDGETLVDDPTTNPKYEEEGQWGLRYLKMPELWKKPVINRRRPVVAVLDSGVDMDHPDLKDNILPGCENNFPPDSYINSIDDEKGHGTCIAGIIAATDDETGIIGANPHALIMPVRVLDKDGSGYTDEIIWGINLAAKNGADIINMGFGGAADNIQSSDDYVRNLEHALYQAIDNAYQTSIIVGSGGNNKKLDSPALNPHVLAVAAYDSYGVLASFAPDDPDGVHSGYGFFDNVYYDVSSNCELRAPGVSILSTWKDGDYNIESGSSMACAYVSGAISALLMLKDYASREELWGDLTHGSDFEEIYNITERPADLDFLGFMADTRKVLEPGKRNVDFKVHAGGSAKVITKLRLFPVLRTVFGKASNIRVHAELDESVNKDLYQLAVADVDFGCELEPYVNEVSKNPFLLKVSPDMSGNDEIIINITATCKETGEVMESSINVRLEKTNHKAVCEPDGGYCVYNDEEKSLTFYYDDLVKERTGEVFSTEPVYDKASEQYFPQWTSLICDRVEHVIFDPSYVDARPESMELWFYMFGNLHTIDNIEYLNTSEVKNMAGTFALCTSLYSIDLSHFDTRSVTNMSNMFWYCTSLYSADLSRFNMSNVTRTDWMFNGCKQLLSVYFNEDWNSLPRLENSADMFAGCSKLMGEAGTKFDSSAPANATLARPDGGKPGYFTTKTILQDADVNVDGTVDVADIAAVISVMAGSRARFRACQSLASAIVGRLAR